MPDPDESAEVQEHTFFTQAESFVNAARYIETMRKRLSPETKTMVNEVGAISAEDLAQGEPGYVFKPIPNSYWNLASATYAYLFGELSRIGIDVVGESQLVGYSTQFPSVSMVDWNDGKPNAPLLDPQAAQGQLRAGRQAGGDAERQSLRVRAGRR